MLEKKGMERSTFDFAFSPGNHEMLSKFASEKWIRPLSVNDSAEEIINQYDLVLSLHSRQFFPGRLVREVRCINIHPGFNPFNRGWFPQVFSIINGLPCGATIHIMDEELDHGPIIAQKEVKVEESDTSMSVYNKVTDAEVELLEIWLKKILDRNYQTTVPGEGNVNMKKDFDALCRLDMNDTATLHEHINLLRALSHGDHSNAYFIDKNGDKVFVKISFIKNEGS